MWLVSLLYLATFGSFIGFSAGFAMLAKTQFPAVDILKLAFFGPFIGALRARSADHLRPSGRRAGDAGQLRPDGAVYRPAVSDPARQRLRQLSRFLRGVYGALLTAGLGSGSTFQMIAVIFRQLTIDSVKAARRQR